MNLGDFLDIIVLLNSSVNFVLYTSMSQQFRDKFKEQFMEPILRCAKAKGKNQETVELAEHERLCQRNQEGMN